MRVLLVDDDRRIGIVFEEILKDKCLLEHVTEGEKAVLKLRENLYDIVFLDLKLKDKDGFSVLEDIKRNFPDVYVVIITGYGSYESAVKAIKKGAEDFITKPIEGMRILKIVESVEEKKRFLRELEKQVNFVGISEEFMKLKEKILKFAVYDTPVLFTGETGVGKDEASRFLHLNSRRKDKVFEKINCASLRGELFSAELFGYEKGAFTGAFRTKKGIVHTADKGTLLLNEITEIPKELQAVLLEFIETKEFRKVGSEKKEKVDLRFVFATNKNLEEEVKRGNFREDLFYRISAHWIHIPPLRERKKDVRYLIDFYNKKFSFDYNREIFEIEEGVYKFFENYKFPGNVRELKNIVENFFVIYKEKRKIILSDIERDFEYLKGRNTYRFFDTSLDLKTATREFQKEFIKRVIRECKTMEEAAKRLKVHRVYLYKILERLGINKK